MRILFPVLAAAGLAAWGVARWRNGTRDVRDRALLPLRKMM
ncbi:hypothetical protein [Cohnella zeiphila]|nr:hypothetical protein [Cohnella zeiphila]